VHVFPEAAARGLVATRGYDPVVCEWTDYQSVQAVLGLERAVLVQPSVYGTDNSALLHCLERSPELLRGVVVVDMDVEEEQLQDWHRKGVRGVRLNLTQPGGVQADVIAMLAPALQRLGWHIQVVCSLPCLLGHMGWLDRSGCDIVVDHWGLPDLGAGAGSTAFEELLERLRSGRWWVKLSAHYRLTDSPGRLAPFAARLQHAATERLLWGSDWPHPDHYGQMPGSGDLCTALRSWLPDDDVRAQVLVGNPRALYGFGAS
jgi:predicted TIM-barrel fold metal-dependent hydrolase